VRTVINNSGPSDSGRGEALHRLLGASDGQINQKYVVRPTAYPIGMGLALMEFALPAEGGGVALAAASRQAE